VPDLISRISNSFSGKRVIIAGDLVADQFLSGSISRVSREAPVFILRHEETETRPGGAANAAANVASLGGEPVVVGLIGDDENGRLLRSGLEQAGVNCDTAVVSSAITTTTKVRVLAGQSYSVKQQVIRIDYENSNGVSDELRSKLILNLEAAASGADAIVVSDYGYGVVTNALFAAAQKISSDNKIPLIVDSRFRLSEFRGATSATPNKEEVEQILGREFQDGDCARLREELGLDSLLITCGNKGIVLAGGRSVERIPVVGSMEPVDVTGAGDTVIAAYSLGLACGLTPRESAIIANHAGGVVVMKKGTATVSKEELIASLLNHSLIAQTDTAA
jgi:rfaE bifunctional protein kinase chain/domain